MTVYRVGSPYNPRVRRWPEGAQYNGRGGEHELLLFFADPSQAEIRGVERGALSLALYVEQPAIFLLYEVAGAIPWSDAPFSIHLVPEAERVLPTLDPGDFAHLRVLLVDAGTGIIRAMRLIGLSANFAGLLHTAIREQAAIPWDPTAYDQSMRALCDRLSSAALAAAAPVVTRVPARGSPS